MLTMSESMNKDSRVTRRESGFVVAQSEVEFTEDIELATEIYDVLVTELGTTNECDV